MLVCVGRHCSARAMVEDDNSASVDDLDERCVLVASMLSDVDDASSSSSFDDGGDRCSSSIDKLGE